MKSVAAIYYSKNKPIKIDEIDINDPKEDQVLIKLYASGICHSQLLNLRRVPPCPELLGHEGTGRVIKIGSKVRNIKEGDDVLISWMPANYNKDTKYFEWSYVKYRGKKIKSLLFTWAKHCIVHKQFVTKLPKNVDRYKSSIIGCAVISGYGTVYNKVKIIKNSSVVIYGVGGLGLLAVNAAKNLKANPIIVIDIDDKKLDFAKFFGATHFINSKYINPEKQIKYITKGIGADFVFDMVGTPLTHKISISSTRSSTIGFVSGGSTVLVGFPMEETKMNTRDLLMGEKKLIGSRGGGVIPQKDFKKFYRDYKSGKLLLDKVVTRVFALEEINNAVNLLKRGKILGRSILHIS